MNTKIILKTLALAMLLVSACNKSEIANDENTEKKGFALPVTVNVTREGDDATKATYNEGTGILSSSAGDKLFVRGTADDITYEFAGTLDYDTESGKFSGTIYINDEWPGTFEELLATVTGDDEVNATLLPAGYGSYGYLSIDDNNTDEKYDDFIYYDNEYTLATSKAAGVEQFSFEKTNTYSDGFALAPENAILNFTITGLAASTNVAVSLTGSGYTITKTITTDGSGNATFAAGVTGGKDLNDFSLTVAGNPITLVSSNKTLAAGKIYNITRNAGPETIVWNSSNWGNNSYNSSNPCTIGDVTLSMTTYNYFYTGDGYAYLQSDSDGNYTFTAPTGKKFTKIEINTDDGDYWPSLGTGWSRTGYGSGKYMFTWTGDASTVKLFDSDTWFEEQAYMYSIKFYVTNE